MYKSVNEMYKPVNEMYKSIGASIGVGMNKRAEQANNRMNTKT